MNSNKKNSGKAKTAAVITLIAGVSVFVLCGLYNGLKVCTYEVQTKSDKNNIRIAVVSDLHSCHYGDNGEKLIAALNEQKPDIVALTGDIFDERMSNDNAESFLKQISARYTCFFVTGNHEYRGGKSSFEERMKIIEKYGIIRLSSSVKTITINGETINIGGVDDPYSSNTDYDGYSSDAPSFGEQLKAVQKLADNGRYTVLLSHRPEFIKQYAACNFDLVLCGHTHGGQWRIPGLLNGLFAPNQGLFPKYAGGEYSLENTTMIVSRGLAKESTHIPRFYNRPELVTVDIH